MMTKLLKHMITVLEKVGGRAPAPKHLAIAGGANVKGNWVYPAEHLIVGDVKQWAEDAGVGCIRIPGYWFEKKGDNRKAGEPAKPGEKVVYALHGGGYGGQSAHPSDLASNVPRGILEYAKTVSRAFTLEFRLSTGPPNEAANSFPAALIDAVAGYNYLVNEVGFLTQNIIVEGDSAGGNLALALVRYLIENKDAGIPSFPAPPHDLILLSPWADLGTSHKIEGTSVYTNVKTDFIDLLHPSRLVPNFLGPFGLDIANRNRYISPASTAPTMEKVSFNGFPRTFIVAGGAEVLRDQIRTLRDRMVVDLGSSQVEYYEPAGAVHDYLIFLWFEPERTETLEAIARWLASE
ncbi:unnamed protein product [Somion occarium]